MRRFLVPVAALALAPTLVLGAGPALAEDPTPPTLVAGTVTPGSLPPEGGAWHAAATITDDEGVASAWVTIYDQGGNLHSSAPLAPGADDGWTADGTLPPTTGPDPQEYRFVVSASDPLDAALEADLGTVLVEGQPQFNQAPYIDGAQASPSTLDHQGGAVTISAGVSDSDGSVLEVSAYVVGPGGTDSVTLETGDGSTWSGTFLAPANDSDQVDADYTVEIYATDDGGQQSSAVTGFTVTRRPEFNEPPVVQSLTVSSASLPRQGGRVTVDTTVTDTEGLSDVSAEVTGPDGTSPLPLTGVSGSDWSGSLELPANPSETAVTYDVTVRAEDSIGQVATETVHVTVAATRPRLRLSPWSIRLGRVPLGERLSVRLVLDHLGDLTPLQVRVPDLAGPCRLAGDRDDGWELTVQPGERVRFRVVCRPTERGRFRVEVPVERLDGKQASLGSVVRGRAR